MLNRCTRLFALLVVLSACSGTEAPPSPQEADDSLAELTSKVDTAVRSYMEEHHLPGSAVVIVQDGKTLFKQGYGVANVETALEVDPDRTIFRIGSISKALTLLTLTRLADQGKVELTDDVATYFEGIQNPNNYEQPLTLWNLLTHTGGLDQIGLDRHIYAFDQPLEDRKASRPSLVDFLQANNVRRVSPAGQYFRYDTYGSTLAGAVLERVTGLPYDLAMKQEMFDPLGMTRTSVEVDAEYMDDLATGYGYVDGAYQPQPYEIYVTQPASSIDATVADMGRLLEALTGGGANDHGRLFGAETSKAVLAPQFRPHPEFVGMTHGLRESFASSGDTDKSVRTIGHGGSMLGFTADLTIIPELNVGIFTIANRDGEAGGGPVRLGRPVLEAMIEALHDGPAEEALQIPERIADQDLSEYTGDYHYGVYCHSCSPEEFDRRAWRRGPPRSVTQQEGALLIADEQYLPRGDDVFVQDNGERMVYFGRDEAGRVSFFVYSTSVDTFERASE